ncbi:hypothetical protein AC579_3034 [Pseudocercospora musae]|uniref:Uncharacterized protein n=1 Tax=Pseudocercospora musae TaxID=113226 RepID=A0A139I467_9PEZI|nr:hypothetical protein AC579_3034 [Pseudocercospora musae]
MSSSSSKPDSDGCCNSSKGQPLTAANLDADGSSNPRTNTSQAVDTWRNQQTPVLQGREASNWKELVAKDPLAANIEEIINSGYDGTKDANQAH